MNEQGVGFFDTTFQRPGEIWLADVTANPVRQWRLAPSGQALVAEPEPLVSGDRLWIFYTQILFENIKSNE